jgi:AraC-like DNA-binding protein
VTRPTVSIHVVRGVFAEAAARGQDPAALCARFGVTARELADPDGRVAVAVLRRIWTELPALVGAEDFGLEVARRAQGGGALTLLAYLVGAARTVGEGLAAALRYQRIVQDAISATWTTVGDDVHVELTSASPLPRHAVEFAFASALLIARRSTGREVRPRAIHVRHARPADDAATRRVFGCELHYEADTDVAILRRRDLELPQLTSDPELAQLLERQARELDVRLPVDHSFVTRIRRVLADELVHGSPTLATVARRLHVSSRTAQRRLHDEGTTLQRVLDELRRDLALHYLDDSTASIQEIAFRLGFADHTAFHHAFVRWTKQTPKAYRQRCRMK